ncbi:hypothetical protein L1987_33523 [Smallanthus sonchifolius]|uniref:Uncharacterized protein n=1 Tax=Smallanthus sonchifolius TaxID=185202 RepID=A0ACB9HTV8_9ASTR|nr:hypothetical protein L1987_33523 [Smallanthus sonchifolius]
MEEERETTRYWCHECSRVVDPVMEAELIKCSLCQGGFLEEMDNVRADHRHVGGGSNSEHGISLWAPILLGMMNTPNHHRRFSPLGFDAENEEENHGESEEHRHQGGGEESELDPELRWRRSSPTILRLLQVIQAGMVSESENNSGGGDNHQERERVILINRLNEIIIVHGGNGGNDGDNQFYTSNMAQNHPFGSFGDYFVGLGLEQLLQHLAENDPNRYGTPPAQKEAVEAMPTITIKENLIQCSVCLEEFENGTEAREMPCKHTFHGDCILPWLELHSSCPFCRYQLPADESKINQQDGSRGNSGNLNRAVDEPGETSNPEIQLSASFPWTFSSLFSSTSGSDNSNSSLVTRSASGGSGSSPRAHEADHQEDSH